MVAVDPGTISFAQFGVLGLLTVAFLAGWIWPKPGVDRLQKDLDRSLEQGERDAAFLRDVAMPAITQNLDLQRDVQQLLRDVQELLREMLRRRGDMS